MLPILTEHPEEHEGTVSAVAVVAPDPGRLDQSPTDAGYLLKHFPPEDLAFDSQAPPLVVAEQDSVLPELLSENPILRQEILDGVLLSAIDPAGQDQKQQLPRLKQCLHVPPDAR